MAYLRPGAGKAREALGVPSVAGAPVNGTTGAGQYDKGTLLVDSTNGVLYINTNTLASPTWTKVGTQS